MAADSGCDANDDSVSTGGGYRQCGPRSYLALPEEGPLQLAAYLYSKAIAVGPLPGKRNKWNSWWPCALCHTVGRRRTPPAVRAGFGIWYLVFGMWYLRVGCVSRESDFVRRQIFRRRRCVLALHDGSLDSVCGYVRSTAPQLRRAGVPEVVAIY